MDRLPPEIRGPSWGRWDEPIDEGIGIGLVNGSIGNKIKHTIVTGNADVDLFHDEESSPNKWIKNTCGTSGGVDIDCP